MGSQNFDYDKANHKSGFAENGVLSRESSRPGDEKYPQEKSPLDEHRGSGINGSDILFSSRFDKPDQYAKQYGSGLRRTDLASEIFGDLAFKDGGKGGDIRSKEYRDSGFVTGGTLDDRLGVGNSELHGRKQGGSEAEFFKLYEKPRAPESSGSLFDDAYQNQKNEPRKKIGSFKVSPTDPKLAGDSVEVPDHPEILGASIQAQPMKDGSIRTDVHWIDGNKLTSSRIPLSEFQKRYPQAIFFRDKYE